MGCEGHVCVGERGGGGTCDLLRCGTCGSCEVVLPMWKSSEPSSWLVRLLTTENMSSSDLGRSSEVGRGDAPTWNGGRDVGGAVP